MHKSDLYFEAFFGAMKNNVGRLFFHKDRPVLIVGIETVDTYNKRLEVQYLADDKIEQCPIDDAEEFFKLFLTKTEHEKEKELIRALGLDTTNENSDGNKE